MNIGSIVLRHLQTRWPIVIVDTELNEKRAVEELTIKNLQCEEIIEQPKPYKPFYKSLPKFRKRKH